MQKEEIERLVGQILDGTELELKVDRYTLADNMETGEVKIHAEVHDAHTGEKKTIEGQGVGIVDAFFNGLTNMYSEEFPSLTTIRFSDFSIRAKLETGRRALSDSHAEVILRVMNSEDREYEFRETSPSLTRASVEAVLSAAEFFINSERAFKQVYRALQHAREQNRHDSVAAYTAQLSTLVEATSYTEVIDRIRKNEQLAGG